MSRGQSYSMTVPTVPFTCLVFKSDPGEPTRPINDDVHGLSHLPELNDCPNAGTGEHHIASLAVQQIQEDHQLHQSTNQLTEDGHNDLIVTVIIFIML